MCHHFILVRLLLDSNPSEDIWNILVNKYLQYYHVNHPYILSELWWASSALNLKWGMPKSSENVYSLMASEWFYKNGVCYLKKPISVSKNTRICSLHFERSEGTVKSLIPTIFPWSIPVKSRHPPAICNPIPPKKEGMRSFQYHLK